jgi:hypothetical protein
MWSKPAVYLAKMLVIPKLTLISGDSGSKDVIESKIILKTCSKVAQTTYEHF